MKLNAYPLIVSTLSGIAKYFKGIFISEKVGYNKPAIEFFEKCFAEISVFRFDLN